MSTQLRGSPVRGCRTAPVLASIIPRSTALRTLIRSPVPGLWTPLGKVSDNVTSTNPWFAALLRSIASPLLGLMY